MVKRNKDIKVLLVDDEEDFVNTLAQRLKMRELNVTTVYNGERALAKVKSEEPDVMVLDLKMPGLQGMDVLKEIRKAYPNIQVIILTGYGTRRDEEQSRRLGGFDFLTKPIDIETLMERIGEAYAEKIARMMTAIDFAEESELVTSRTIIKESLWQ
jgi:DNA-binding NtrC family response regulator